MGSAPPKTGSSTYPAALVLCNHEGIANQVINCLHLLSVEVHVLGGPGARFLRLSRYVAGFHALKQRIEECGSDELAQRITDIVRRKGIGVVLGADFETARALAEVEHALPVCCFPAPPPATLDLYNDKAAFLDLARAAGAPVADSVVLRDKRQLRHDELVARFGLPYVVKPTGAGNGNGLIVVADAAGLERHILGNPHYQYAPLIVAPFLPGRDVGLSLFATEGQVRAAVAQVRSGPAITFVACPPLAEAAARVVAAGSYTGVAHIDARLGEDGSISLLECNARFWSSIFALASAGPNFVELGLAARFGRSMPALPDVAGQSVMPPNHVLLNWLRLRVSVSAASRRWLGVVAGDPMIWLASDGIYNLKRIRKLHAGTGRYG